MLSLTITSLLVANKVLASMPYPPVQPLSYPSDQQTDFIEGEHLTDPMILQAIEHVTNTVDASLLSIPPSTYNPGTPNSPTYHADPVANCYWPNGLCVRREDTQDYKADISACRGANQWGLTYDDGPTKGSADSTVQLLEELKAQNIKATFFVTGTYSIRNPDVLSIEDEDGHELALHTWSHHPLTSLTNEQVIAELMYNQAIVHLHTGRAPTLYRPPYGDVDDRVRAIATALGFRTAYWTVDSHDYRPDEATILETMREWFPEQAGFISLQHDISAHTCSLAMSSLREYSAFAGAKSLPMPVSRCLGIDDQEKWYKGHYAVDGTSDGRNGANSGYDGDDSDKDKATPFTFSSASQMSPAWIILLTICCIAIFNLVF